MNLPRIPVSLRLPGARRRADRRVRMDRSPMPVSALFEVRVLVVEDDADLIESVRRVLPRSFRVTACRSARAAVSIVEAGKFFDVLVPVGAAARGDRGARDACDARAVSPRALRHSMMSASYPIWSSRISSAP